MFMYIYVKSQRSLEQTAGRGQQGKFREIRKAYKHLYSFSELFMQVI